MTADATSLRQFEQMLANTIRTVSVEHAELIRKVSGVVPGRDLTFIVYSSFFGHTLEMMVKALGRKGVFEVIDKVLGQVEIINQTVEKAAEVGVALDTYSVLASIPKGGPS